MSRIEKALEKAANLRNTPGIGVALKEAEGKALIQPIRLHTPPTIDRSELMAQIENPLLATLCEPHSSVSEEYRKLKSVVVTFARQDGFRNVIMVTSSVSNEGKSLTSLNLAITLAQEHDHTVLLVDADLRNPSIQKYLNIEPAKGLSDYLNGEATSISDLLVKTGIGRLTYLPAGTPIKNPVELFSSQKMRDFIAEIRNRYNDRFIIIDTPPLLPFAETRSLCAIADGVLFIIREGQATPDNIGEAMKALDSSKLIGAVYNDATTASLDGHYHYYGYGSGGEKTANR
jgi:exopolysaccharide/PEP-CTERM locus tyrosine autokinase